MTLAELVARACQRHGLVAPDMLPEPGGTCRIDDLERPGGRSGWLLVHGDGCGVSVMNWRADIDGRATPYRLDGAPAVTDPLLRAAAKWRREALRVTATEAAADCARIWDAAAPASADHPYLVDKGVTYAAVELRQIPAPLRNLGERHAALVGPVLLVPGYRENELRPSALTYIDARGEKLWHPGCPKDGHFGVMYSAAWSTPGPIYVAEGLATAASIAAQQQRPCCYCFDAGNMPKAGRRIRSLLPTAELVVCTDDDKQLADAGKPNKGVIKARETAAAIGARFVAPDFTGAAQRGEKDSDANDAVRLTGRLILSPNPPTLAAPPHEQLLAQDLWAVRDQGKYYHRPSRKFLAAETVDKSIGPKTSSRLMQTQAVSEAVWAPGEPEFICGRRLADGGWISDQTAVLLNTYRPPLQRDGDPRQAERWLDHVRHVWPDDAEHIVMWMAHRTQRPGEKINHALVLGGAQGIGKDSALQPLAAAVGETNYKETSPRVIAQSEFNPYVKAIVLRINEARDLGETGRYHFYDQMKTLAAAPPDMLVVNDKHMRALAVLNVVGVIYTTNYRTGGMHLAPDDRRHYVAWSDIAPAAVDQEGLAAMWRWFAWENGYGHVTAYLRGLDISTFDAKAPPRKTPAFWAMVESGRGQEVDEIADCVREMGEPAVLTADQVVGYATAHGKEAVKAWLGRPENRRHVPRRLEECGYEYYRNPESGDGRWQLGDVYVRCYARQDADWLERNQAIIALRNGAIIRRR